MNNNYEWRQSSRRQNSMQFLTFASTAAFRGSFIHLLPEIAIRSAHNLNLTTRHLLPTYLGTSELCLEFRTLFFSFRQETLYLMSKFRCLDTNCSDRKSPKSAILSASNKKPWRSAPVSSSSCISIAIWRDLHTGGLPYPEVYSFYSSID